jgi:hypothetical protein
MDTMPNATEEFERRRQEETRIANATTRRRDETRFADLFATPQMRVISAKHSAIGRTGPPATLDIHFVLHAYLHDPHLAQPLQKACLLDLGYYCTELKLRAPQPTDNANSNHTSEWGRYTF